MNILVLTSTYPKFPGDSTAPFIESLVTHVAGLGHEVHLVVPEHRDWNRPGTGDGVHFHLFRYSPRASWTPWGFAQSLESGTKLHRSLYALAPLVFLAGVRTCSRIAAAHRVDLVHAHWALPNGPIAATAAWRRRLPLVVSVHGSDIALSERSRWMGSLTRRSFDRAAVVTAASRHMLERAETLGARPGSLELVPYGMDLAAFHPDDAAGPGVRARLGIAPDETLVLGIGRLVEWKGFDYLIRAMGLVRDRAPDARLVIAGDGDEREALTALARSLGLGDRVTFVGMVQREEVPGYFAAADLVAVPSIRHPAGFVEALGYVVHEALAAGKPVIASRVGGLPEVVRDGHTGYLVEERDPAAIADAIAALAQDPALRKRLGTNARARALEAPTWDEVAVRWVATYERALDAAPAASGSRRRSGRRVPAPERSPRRGGLNILVLTMTYPKFEGDTTAPFMASITEHVAALGHTVHVVLPEHRELRRAPVEGRIHFHPYRYSPVRSWTPWGYAQSLEEGVKLRRSLYALSPAVLASARRTCHELARQESFDVVHAHWVVPNGAIARGVSTKWGAPLVITLHGSDVSISERSPWIGYLARRAFDQAAVVTAPSHDLLDRARRLGASGELERIPWGADLDAFSAGPDERVDLRQRLGVTDDEFLVLGVGRFISVKGFSYLVDAVSRTSARLVLVGDGDLRGELQDQASRLRVADRVTFAGMVARDEIPAYFAAADAVTAPSIRHEGYVDGLPNVALEAMAAGKPLIATRVGGLPDLVVEGETGLLVEERDPGALAAAIRTLAASPDLGARMGAQARKRVADSLNWDEVARRLVEVYERVALDAARRRR